MRTAVLRRSGPGGPRLVGADPRGASALLREVVARAHGPENLRLQACLDTVIARRRMLAGGDQTIVEDVVCADGASGGVGVVLRRDLGVPVTRRIPRGPKTKRFGAARGVSRRPITAAVFPRAVRHRRARRRCPSRFCTAARRATPAEIVAAEDPRMVAAALCGRVRASLGAPAGRASIADHERRRGPLGRCKECLGVRLGA